MLQVASMRQVQRLALVCAGKLETENFSQWPHAMPPHMMIDAGAREMAMQATPFIVVCQIGPGFKQFTSFIFLSK